MEKKYREVKKKLIHELKIQSRETKNNGCHKKSKKDI